RGGSRVRMREHEAGHEDDQNWTHCEPPCGAGGVDRCTASGVPWDGTVVTAFFGVRPAIRQSAGGNDPGIGLLERRCEAFAEKQFARPGIVVNGDVEECPDAPPAENGPDD